MFTTPNILLTPQDASKEGSLSEKPGGAAPFFLQLRHDLVFKKIADENNPAIAVIEARNCLESFPGAKLSAVLKKDCAVKWDLQTFSGSIEYKTRRYWYKEPLETIKAHGGITRTNSSSNSSINSKSTLVGSTLAVTGDASSRSTLSQCAEKPEEFPVSKLRRLTLHPSTVCKHYTNKGNGGNVKQLDCDSGIHCAHQPSIRSQCGKKVKELLRPSWTADNDTSKTSKGTQFVLRRHPQYSDVLEVIDCEDELVAYRKLSRHSKPWRETFHEAISQRTQANKNLNNSNGSSSDRPTAPWVNRQSGYYNTQSTDICLPSIPCKADSFVGSVDWFSTGSKVSSRGSSISSSSSSNRCSRLTSPLSTPSSLTAASFTSVDSSNRFRMQQNLQNRYPSEFNINQLWEISSPCPATFPLHCRDARGVIDPIPLTPLVLDRHQFCYRFHLAGNKMRWLAKKRQGYSIVELQCYVRNTVIALLLPGGHTIASSKTLSTSNNISTLSPSSASSNNIGSISSVDSGGFDRYSRRESNGNLSSLHEPVSIESVGGYLPNIIILPAAYSKLSSIDPSVVESFVLFTGIEVLECFLSAA
ncbi:hypothetical protein GGI25_000564 [Coemansia spiralis]|uniref:Uncharacterized protein n=2 Tax=Coemansia TaxID=4863 RepID=A0A9W8GE17_9FUNG|nr:hypothetical protein BX070DRAFT_228521 [Coemansia spiralis]KAJ1996025.1 hypothetical protein EDC05_000393 [Coemansia umbellata]KAJ2680591.1 hypothetical protein GGI25_000564 [Coemansia spiralis]